MNRQGSIGRMGVLSFYVRSMYGKGRTSLSCFNARFPGDAPLVAQPRGKTLGRRDLRLLRMLHRDRVHQHFV